MLIRAEKDPSHHPFTQQPFIGARTCVYMTQKRMAQLSLPTTAQNWATAYLQTVTPCRSADTQFECGSWLNTKRELVIIIFVYIMKLKADLQNACSHGRVGKWRALLNDVMNLRVPWNAGNFLTSWETVSFSRRTVLHGVSHGRVGWLLCSSVDV